MEGGLTSLFFFFYKEMNRELFKVLLFFSFFKRSLFLVG